MYLLEGLEPPSIAGVRKVLEIAMDIFAPRRLEPKRDWYELDKHKLILNASNALAISTAPLR